MAQRTVTATDPSGPLIHLRGNQACAYFDTSEGRFSAEVAGLPLFSGATCRAVTLRGVLEFKAGEVSVRRRPIPGPWGQGEELTVWQNVSAGMSTARLGLRLSVSDGLSGVIIQLALENLGEHDLAVEVFEPVRIDGYDRGRLGLAGQDTMVLKHGWQSWSPSLTLAPSDRDPDPRLRVGRLMQVNSATPPRSRRSDFASESFIAFGGSQGASAVGFASAARQLGTIFLDCGSWSLTACADSSGKVLAPGEALQSERVVWLRAPSREEALADYASVAAHEHKRRPAVPPVTGWSSTYAYVSPREEDILENLEFLSAHRAELPVEVIQIGDGFQAATGDWLAPSPRFPQGLAWLAERIRAKGFRPGIWLAPFVVSPRSSLWARQDWLLKDEAGRSVSAGWNPAWGGKFGALDLTHPDAGQWLAATLRTIRAWGYDYLTLDYLYAGALPGTRYNPRLTRAEALRAGLSLIAEAAGEATIAAAGCPILPALGLADRMRVGPDMPHRARVPLFGKPGFAALRPVLANVAARGCLHGKWWINDAGGLLVGEDDTRLSMSEAIAAASLLALSGASTMLGDRLAALDVDRAGLLAKLLPHLGEPALPAGAEPGGLPTELRLPIRSAWGEWQVVGLFNWGIQRAVEVPLAGKAVHVYDFWDDAYLGLHEGTLRLELPARSCKLLRVTPDDSVPQVVGSTSHYTQGLAELPSVHWSAKSARLQLGLRPRPVSGRIAVRLPMPYRFGRASGAQRLEVKGDILYITPDPVSTEVCLEMVKW